MLVINSLVICLGGGDGVMLFVYSCACDNLMKGAS